ncbi:MAG TPA: hypothetical protein EYF95_04795 [Flavobacteriales bacterium]|nr:hypothetical protein [Flavobacteriales bacterium]
MDKSSYILRLTIGVIVVLGGGWGFNLMDISKCVAQSSLHTIPSDLEMISDTGRISWGERATITLRLGLELGEKSTGWPIWEDTIPGGLEILSTSKIDTILPQKDDPDQWDMIVEQSWVVTAWDSGYVVIPEIEVMGEKSAPVMIQVVPTRTGEAPEMMPAAEIIKIEWTFWDRIEKAAPYVLKVLAALLFALGLIYLLKKVKRKERVEIEMVVPDIPPHITALEKLRELEERKGWTKGEAKSFHVQLSEIIRTYIDARFSISSLESTTREAAAQIDLLDISQSDKSNLISALRLGDKIKFAKHTARTDDHIKVIKTCIEFVENTMENPES